LAATGLPFLLRAASESPYLPWDHQGSQPPKAPNKPQSTILKYVTFLGCEFDHDIEQLTDEEDGQNPKQIAIVVTAVAVVGALKGKLPGWTGITGAIAGGLYVINIAGHSNIECSESVYGH
jgi:hypothetical protein